MYFRVTSLAIQDQAILFSQRHNADIFRLQQQISSGIRLHRPSDDPAGFRQVTSLNTRFNELVGELETIRSAESILNNSVSQLQDASRLISSAVTAVQQSIQSTEPLDRNALALELEGTLNQLRSIANTQFNGEYVYGGTRTDTRPYEFSGPAAEGRLPSSNYVGSGQNGTNRIGNSLVIDNYYSGPEIFGRGDRGDTVLFGTTGAQPGPGTDSLTGRANLLVTHDTTTFAGASGVAAGTSSPGSDTIIGSHQLTIVDTSGTGASGTVSFNGGNPIPFDNSQTDLLVTGPGGETVYLDTTAIAAGFSGTVDVSASGFLSVDDGATQTAIDFSDTQIISDSITGQFVTIDSREIQSTGTDQLEFPGTSDLFQTVAALISDLRNERELNPGELNESLDRRFAELETSREKVLSAIGEQATSLSTLESVAFRNESLQLQIETRASELQATDISDAVLRLTNAQSLLQYTYAVTAQIASIRVLDFLR